MRESSGQRVQPTSSKKPVEPALRWVPPLLLGSGVRVATIFQVKSGKPRGRRSMRLVRGTDAALGNRPLCIINFNGFNCGGRAQAPAVAKFDVAATHVGTSSVGEPTKR